jgi:hypothetical protein
MSAENRGLLEQWLEIKRTEGSSPAVFMGQHLLDTYGDAVKITEPRKIDEKAIALRHAKNEYKKNPDSLETISNFWTTFWARNGSKVGLDIKVDPIPTISSDYLKEAREKGKGLIYVPLEVSGQKNRYLLGEMFPKMKRDGVVEGNYFTNILARFGWRWFDIKPDAPNLYTFECDLKKNLVNNIAAEPTLNEYIIASQISKMTTGSYLDEKTYCRILGSNFDGISALVSFHGKGGLSVQFIQSDKRSEKIGARFSWFASPQP